MLSTLLLLPVCDSECPLQNPVVQRHWDGVDEDEDDDDDNDNNNNNNNYNIKLQ
jgi:hypothetical protein